MRSMMVAACVAGLFAFAAPAQAGYLGGPMKMGKMCWLSTTPNDNGGMWAKCPKPMKMKRAMKKSKKKAA